MRTFILAALAIFFIGLTFAQAAGPVRRVVRRVQARRIQRIQVRRAAIVVGRQAVVFRRQAIVVGQYQYRRQAIVSSYSAQQIVVAPTQSYVAAPPVAQEAVPAESCPIQVAPVQYTQRIILRQQVGGCYNGTQSLRLGFRY